MEEAFLSSDRVSLGTATERIDTAIELTEDPLPRPTSDDVMEARSIRETTLPGASFSEF